PVEGPSTGQLAEETRERIRRALRQGANLLILDLRCAGGRIDDAHELGLYLARLNDDRPNDPVDTIAYVTTRARNLAVLLALGCQRIGMQKAESSDGKDSEEDETLPPGALGGGSEHNRNSPPPRKPPQKKWRQPPAGNPRRARLEQTLAEQRRELEEDLRNKLTDLAER